MLNFVYIRYFNIKKQVKSYYVTNALDHNVGSMDVRYKFAKNTRHIMREEGAQSGSLF